MHEAAHPMPASTYAHFATSHEGITTPESPPASTPSEPSGRSIAGTRHWHPLNIATRKRASAFRVRVLRPLVDIAVAVEIFTDAIDLLAFPVLPVVELAVTVGVSLFPHHRALLVEQPEGGAPRRREVALFPHDDRLLVVVHLVD